LNNLGAGYFRKSTQISWINRTKEEPKNHRLYKTKWVTIFSDSYEAYSVRFGINYKWDWNVHQCSQMQSYFTGFHTEQYLLIPSIPSLLHVDVIIKVITLILCFQVWRYWLSAWEMSQR